MSKEEETEFIIYTKSNCSFCVKLKEFLRKEGKTFSEKNCDNILKITPIQYNLKKDPTKSIFFGISAQEIEEYFPELVVTNTNNIQKQDSFKSIKYLELIPILITKIQNMQKKIDDLELKVNGSSI